MFGDRLVFASRSRGRSAAAVRAQQFFFGQVTATRSRSYFGSTEPQLTLPVISENRLKQARRALFDGIRKDYPDAVNHQGQLLVDSLPR